MGRSRRLRLRISIFLQTTASELPLCTWTAHISRSFRAAFRPATHVWPRQMWPSLWQAHTTRYSIASEGYGLWLISEATDATLKNTCCESSLHLMHWTRWCSTALYIICSHNEIEGGVLFKEVYEESQWCSSIKKNMKNCCSDFDALFLFSFTCLQTAKSSLN